MTEPIDVSVVIAAYQSAPYLEATLTSVRSQTRAAQEIIVVDDGSTDETAAIAERLGATVIRQPNGGPSLARNAGILAASSPWVAFLDADDLWEHVALERLTRAAQLNPGVDLIFADSITFDENGSLPGTDLGRYSDYGAIARTTIAPGIVCCERASLIAGFRQSMFILTSTVLARRDALLACGLFDPSLRIAEDWDLFLRLMCRTTAAVVEEPLARYRLHGKNITREGAVNGAYYTLLTQRVREHPERYPDGSAEHFAAEAPRWMWRNGVDALREGRFADARAAFNRSHALQPSQATAMANVLASALDNRVARIAYRWTREIWKRRPWKYRAADGVR